MNGAQALSAGFVLILVSVIVAAIGAGIGYLAGSVFVGGFIGIVAGLFAGYAVVWKAFFVPMRRASLERDYSHLTPDLDEDE